MKLITSLILSASLLCAAPDYIAAVKPKHSHKKLYITLLTVAATSFAVYEINSHHRPLPFPPMAPQLPQYNLKLHPVISCQGSQCN